MSELEALCEKRHISCVAHYGGAEVPEGWAHGTHPYKVHLRYKGRKLTTPFFMGPACEREPSAADVLSVLLTDASCGDMSFDEFCRNMGLDTDSRKAERTWKACRDMIPRLHRFLGDDFEDFASAEH
jgi:hypothetical protein